MKEDSTRYDEDFERSLFEDILDFLKVFLALSLVIVVLAFFVFKPVVISGKSMLPTFIDNQKGVSNIIALSLEGVQRGDVVVAKVVDEQLGEVNVVKRAIGLPGETISCQDGIVYIDTRPLDESGWLDEDFMEESMEKYGYFNEDFGPVVLNEDEYFLLGDNRPISRDSRDLGPFTSSQILAKDLLTIYPMNRFGYYG